MVEYSIEIKLSAQKELDGLDDTLFTRIDRKIWHWPAIPGPLDAKTEKLQRSVVVRVGDWWVVYTIDDAERLVSVNRVAHRRDAYE